MSQLLKPTWSEVKAHVREERKALITDCCTTLRYPVNAWLNDLIDKALPGLCQRADRRRAQMLSMVKRFKASEAKRETFVNRAKLDLKTRVKK